MTNQPIWIWRRLVFTYISERVEGANLWSLQKCSSCSFYSWPQWSRLLRVNSVIVSIFDCKSFHPSPSSPTLQHLGTFHSSHFNLQGGHIYGLIAKGERQKGKIHKYMTARSWRYKHKKINRKRKSSKDHRRDSTIRSVFNTHRRLRPKHRYEWITCIQYPIWPLREPSNPSQIIHTACSA